MLEYMSELFDQKTMNRLYESFISILQQIVANSNGMALSGSLLSPQDVEEIAALSMGEERPSYLTAPLMHESFEALAGSSPERRCLCFDGKWLNYGEAETRASKIASHLAALGVGPGVVVGVMMDRSFELLVSILAVMKAGGCYLPCDPSYPDDRLAIYLEDGGAKLMLVQPEHAARAKSIISSETQIIDIASISGNAESSPLKRAGPEDAAYIIFTSGSTGRPKGVMVPYRALRDHVIETAELYGMGPEDASLLTITINFDPHLMQALTPLIIGAGLVIAKPEGHGDGDYVTQLISEQGVTHFVSTPSLALVQFQGKHATACTALRYVMFGGEQLPREVVNLFAEKVGCSVLVSTIECTAYSTYTLFLSKLINHAFFKFSDASMLCI